VTRTRPALRVGAGAALISFSPVFVAVAHTGPTAVAFYRMLVGGAVLTAVVAWRRLPLPSRRTATLAALCGLLLGTDLVTWHHAIRAIGPGMATMLSNFEVLVVAGFGIVVLRERPSWRFGLGVALATIALILVFGHGWSAAGPAQRWGVVLGLLTAVLYAAFLLVLRTAQIRTAVPSPVTTLMVLSLVGAAGLAVAIPLSGEAFGIPDAGTGLALAGYGLISQVFGWLLIAHGLPGVSASRAGLLLLLQPFLAVVWDAAFFGRATTPRDVLGVLAALAAIYMGSVSGDAGVPTPERPLGAVGDPS
jgi:drug/metabolite transporter (DMT)-like permease